MQDLTAKVKNRGSCKYLFENVYLFSNNGHWHCLPGDLESFFMSLIINFVREEEITFAPR